MGDREVLSCSPGPDPEAGRKRPPALIWDTVVSLITRLFPFKDVAFTSFKEISCYDDRLYYFEGRLEGELVRKPFVLKLSNGNFGHALVSGQNAVMLHLRAKGIQCCEPVITKLGHHLEMLSEAQLVGERGGDDVTYIVRVLRYIPGELMDEVDRRYLTPELVYSVGNFVGQMDMALQVRPPYSPSSTHFSGRRKVFSGQYFCIHKTRC